MACHFCWGPFSALQQGKAVCGHWGKAILCATWGVYQIRAFLRMPPKLCSLLQLVSRAVRHKLFRVKFDVWRSPRNWPKKGEIFFQEREKSPFITNQMKLLITRKPRFLWIGRFEFLQYTDDSIIHCYFASRHTALVTQKYVAFYLTSGRNMVCFTSL